MDLNHSFTVPATIADTWKTFEDIESVAGCFPGAVVTEVDGNDFKGTCKVKLGPIAMVYSGTGTFLEKDEAARKFVIEAKGKDKRGNGTAGALVTATFADEGGDSTRVDVQTDLAITGKPAQFGRGVIEDISNKLLQQFVTCLQDKVGAPVEEQVAEAAAVEEPVAEEPVLPSPGAAGASTEALSASGDEPGGVGPGASAPAAPAASAPPKAASAAVSKPAASKPSAGPASDDALDLGATVLPILARTYGPQAAIALVALVIGYLLGRRRD
ncbi:MAG: SRPBCC family protein [Nocardioidaceae bacterium]